MTAKASKNKIYALLVVVAIVLVALLVPILAGKVILTNTKIQENSRLTNTQAQAAESPLTYYNYFDATYHGVKETQIPFDWYIHSTKQTQIGMDLYIFGTKETTIPLDWYIHSTKSKANERFDNYLKK